MTSFSHVVLQEGVDVQIHAQLLIPNLIMRLIFLLLLLLFLTSLYIQVCVDVKENWVAGG